MIIEINFFSGGINNNNNNCRHVKRQKLVYISIKHLLDNLIIELYLAKQLNYDMLVRFLPN